MKQLTIPLALVTLLGASSFAVAESDMLEEGRKVYEKACARCHESGIMGAPLVSDPEQWTTLDKEVWSDVQIQHIEEGFLRSSGKKGVSEQDVQAATQYMMSITH